MTAIAAWCGVPSDDGLSHVTGLLAATRSRGDVVSTVCCANGTCLGAAPFDWQLDWTGPGTGRCGHVTVAADATLYYLDDLVAGMGDVGVFPPSRAPADLIAAAITAWGDEATDHLEGDYAFVAVHEGTGVVHLARDWGGLRSLYVATIGQRLACASEATPLTHLPGVDGRLNLPWLAEAAGGRFESPNESVYRGIRLIPAGSVWRSTPEGDQSGRTLRQVRSFEPPAFRGESHAEMPFDIAKTRLRSLMEAAVRERMPGPGDVSVALSGGRDSTAVYALARAIAGDRVRSMSVSYPEGDPGREDDVVREVLSSCGGEAHWIHSSQLGILATVQQAAGGRHEPFGHVFAEFQEALARAARQLGTRVVLNGSGGDQLFSGEPTYLADLLRGGRLKTLRREWRALQLGLDWRTFFRLAVRPNMGPVVCGILAVLRGQPVLDPFDQPLPPWIRGDFARQARLEARHRVNFPSRAAAGSAANFERRWLLTHPYFPRVFAEAYRLYLKEGVELRTPLADMRLLRFAATRPRWERREGWQVKTLMRNALADLLPPAVTRDRPRPTGTTEGLLERAVGAHLPTLIEATVQDAVLGALGILDVDSLRKAGERIRRGTSDPEALPAIHTVLVEAWLRAHIPADTAMPG